MNINNQKQKTHKFKCHINKSKICQLNNHNYWYKNITPHFNFNSEFTSIKQINKNHINFS
jgi:hypothetical protein